MQRGKRRVGEREKQTHLRGVVKRMCTMSGQRNEGERDMTSRAWKKDHIFSSYAFSPLWQIMTDKEGGSPAFRIVFTIERNELALDMLRSSFVTVLGGWARWPTRVLYFDGNFVNVITYTHFVQRNDRHPLSGLLLGWQEITLSLSRAISLLWPMKKWTKRRDYFCEAILRNARAL